MKDNWKKIWQENKQEIQTEFELPKGHEQRFTDRLKKHKKNHKSFKYRNIAAVFIPLFLLSTIFWVLLQKKSPKENSIELADYSFELNEASDQLNFIVEQKSEKLKDLKEENNQFIIDDSFKKLKDLQEEHQKILKDLQESGGNPQVIQSILLNLQLQVEILQNTLNNISNHESIKPKDDAHL